MRFELSDVHREIRQAAAAFAAAELQRRAEELAREPSAAVDRQLAELGLWGLTIAEDRGGIGLDALAFALVVEELSAASPSIAWRFALHAGPASAALSATDVELEAIATGEQLATAVAGQYGAWPAAWVVRADKVYEASAIQVSEVQTMGLCGSGLARLEVRGSAAHSVSDVQSWVDLAAAAVMIGAARGAMDAATAYAQERKQFNKSISSFQAIQWKIADGCTGIDAARLLTHAAARDLRQAGAARLLAGREGLRATSDALQIHGGYGYTKEYPVERMLRAVRMLAKADHARTAIAQTLLT